MYIPLICSILKSGPKNRLPTTAGGVAVDNAETDIALLGGWSSTKMVIDKNHTISREIVKIRRIFIQS